MNSDATYIVDVAASFSGEQTLSQMDALTSKLVTAGANADSFQNAVVSLSQSLDVAAAASIAANKALADGNSEYRLLEQAANQAAKAQEKAARLGVVRPEVAASLEQANAALAAHTTKLGGLETAAKSAAAREDELSRTLGNVKKLSAVVAADQSKNASLADRNLKKLRAGLAGVGGPLGALGAAAASSVDDFRDLEDSLGSSGAKLAVFGAGAGIVVAAVLAITAVVIAGTVAIAAWAVGLADARRNASLTSEAVEAFNPQLGALHDTIKGLTAETGLTEGALDGIAKGLIAAKVSAADLPEALRAAALAERALGQGGAAEFTASLKDAKKSVAVLSAEAQSKLGGIVAKQMRGLGAQAATLKTTVARLFGGLEIEPVLRGFERLAALFDENTAAGSAIKLLFESVFQPLINQADKAAIVVEAFALGFLIGLTKLYIAVKPAVRALAEFFGFNDPTLESTLNTVAKAGEYLVPIVVGLAGVFGLLAGAVALALVPFGLIAAVIGAQVYAAVYLVSKLVQGVIGAWHMVTDFLDSITLTGVGTAIMQGLANGIASAAGLPLQAITGAVSAAISGAKNILGIHSPSKVFAEIGGYTAEGFAEGVDDTAPEAQSALSRMVEPPQITISAGKQQAASSSSGGAAKSFSFDGARFEFYGVKDGEHAKDMFSEMLTRLLEGDALQAAGAE